MNIRKINYPLIIGTLILFMILLGCLYPEYFSNANPYGKQGLEYVTQDGTAYVQVPPLAPCKEYPWGTDHLGRDMKSLIVYGCKTTMIMALIIAFGRLLIAIPLAILAAYKNRIAAWLIKQFNIIFSAFPLLILVLLISSAKIFADLDIDTAKITIFLLIVFGWGKFATLIKKEIEGILREDFIEGEIAIGKSKLEISIQNIIPHIIPSVVIQFFMEVAIVLLILAQLGLLGLLLSGGYYNDEGELRVPCEFDWASLLVFSNLLFGTDKIWLVTYPSLAFAVSIIGFNLFGEGLKIEFGKRNSNIITFLRRIPSFVSPIKFVYEIKHFGERKKGVYQKVALYLAVILIIFFPQPRGICSFDITAAADSLNELKSEKYKGIINGSRDYVAIASYLSSEMKKSGLQPFEGSYLHEIKTTGIDKQHNPAVVSIVRSDGSESFQLGYDYMFENYIFTYDNYSIEVCSKESLQNLSKERILELRNKAIIVDARKLKDTDYRELYKTIFCEIRPKVYVAIDEWKRGLVYEKSEKPHIDKNETIMLTATSEMGDQLLKMGEKDKLSVKVLPGLYPYEKGINVIGCIPGTDEKLKNEYIILGCHIDLKLDSKEPQDKGELGYGGTALQLQLAKSLAQSGIKPKRTIIFAFWDGPIDYSRGSTQFADKFLYEHPEKKAIYLDLRSLASMRSDKLLIDASRTVPKHKLAQDFVTALRQCARRNDVEIGYAKIRSSFADDFWGKNREAIVLDNDVKQSRLGKYYDDINYIDKDELDKIGQMLLDTIIEISK